MTPHIESKKDEIASTVIMPGDPMRAKFIAETYLTEYKLVNKVRGMLAYTGYYKDKKVTVMASGMGIPSMGIYSYELFKFYDVDNIIRVGTCGAYTSNLNLYDVILVDNSYSNSNFAKVQNGYELDNISSSVELTNRIKSYCSDNNIDVTLGRVYSSDVFYSNITDIKNLVDNKKCIAVEMETFALFHNAHLLGKNAAAVLTVSDNVVTKVETTSEERERSFTKMIEIVLNSVL